jgi:A/G-specific adenine glycosylase
VELWEGAETILNQGEAFDYNQAMMDLGATICTPRNPRCSECPANSICQGKTAPESYPIPKAKKAVPVREVTITVNEDVQGRLHLTTRGEKLLGGLWGFPQSPYRPMKNELGIVTHIYSHFKLVGHVVLGASPQSRQDWFTHAQIARLPLSKLDHKVLALVEKHHSVKKKSTKSSRKRMAH